MSAHASIDVQFKPYRLTLLRGNDGVWVARLARIGEEHAPLVVANSSPEQPWSAARISMTGGEPRLSVGYAAFAVPTRQLQRLREWIEAQSTPAFTIDVVALNAIAGGGPGPVTGDAESEDGQP
jgi:hypothetical protein